MPSEPNKIDVKLLFIQNAQEEKDDLSETSIISAGKKFSLRKGVSNFHANRVDMNILYNKKKS